MSDYPSGIPLNAPAWVVARARALANARRPRSAVRRRLTATASVPGSTTFPGGFVEAIGGDAANVPVPPSQAWLFPLGGANGVRDMGLDASLIGVGSPPEYIPDWYPDSELGGFGIGVTGVGVRRPFHGQIDSTLQVGVQPVDDPLDAIIEEPEGYPS